MGYYNTIYRYGPEGFARDAVAAGGDGVRIVEHASGFIYYVAIAGITGTRSADSSDVVAAVTRLRRFTDLPIAVGFGIRTPEQAAAVAHAADAAVVGTALVQRLALNLDPDGHAEPGLVDAVLADVRALAAGIARN